MEETTKAQVWTALVGIARVCPAGLLGAIEKGGRAEAIELLVWNDPNGVWSDGDLEANDLTPMTDAEAFEALREQVAACVEA